MFRTIVLAVDGSKSSEKALELAKRLATATSDEVVVTHVTELEEAGVKARLELRSAQYGGVAHKVLHLSQRPVLIAR
jgi:nucleotide-binding universal stress UspA family protein